LRFSITLADTVTSNKNLIAAAYDYTHSLDVISGAGHMPASASFVTLESGMVAVSAIKVPEDGEAGELVVRV